MTRSASSLQVAAEPAASTKTDSGSRSNGRRRPPKVEHPSRAQRAADGKATRQRLPLESQAEFSRDGRDDPVTILEGQALTRVPELVPIRYGRMLTAPFSFYRGAALIMATDLAGTPSSGLQVQLCGDAHMSNFGIYASPERELVFDINDFDETHPGPFEWDVKRLAASLVVAGRDNGYSAKRRRKIVMAAAHGYRQSMTELAGQGNLAVWYSHANIEEVLAGVVDHLDVKRKESIQKVLDKAHHRDSLQALAKLTTMVDGRARILSQPPLLVPVEEMAGAEETEATYELLRVLLRSYRRTLQWDRRHLLEQFQMVQLARKVVGVGSVGTRAWILLFEGLDGGDPLFLQAKEAQASVLAGFVKTQAYKNQGERVVNGQHLMQASSDIFLGWQRAQAADGVSRDFYLRQLRDGKGSVVVEGMLPDGMQFYGRICGEALARAHARSGDRVAIAAYLGKSDRFENAIADFAESCAEQNTRDHDALREATRTGRIIAQTGI